jgi:hypothetical protein
MNTLPEQTQTPGAALVFEKVLCAALNVALGGQCALVIVPQDCPKQFVLSHLVHLVPPDRAHQVRRAGNELHFEGTRGSVRVYSTDYIEYDVALKRMRGYPHGTPTFLHPQVEGL